MGSSSPGTPRPPPPPTSLPVRASPKRTPPQLRRHCPRTLIRRQLWGFFCLYKGSLANCVGAFVTGGRFFAQACGSRDSPVADARCLPLRRRLLHSSSSRPPGVCFTWSPPAQGGRCSSLFPASRSRFASLSLGEWSVLFIYFSPLTYPCPPERACAGGGGSSGGERRRGCTAPLWVPESARCAA